MILEQNKMATPSNLHLKFDLLEVVVVPSNCYDEVYSAESLFGIFIQWRSMNRKKRAGVEPNSRKNAEEEKNKKKMVNMLNFYLFDKNKKMKKKVNNMS